MSKFRKLRVWRYLKVFMIVVVVWGFIHLCVLLYFGLIDIIQYSDAAIVFGHQVYNDGTPSTRLRSRLDRAVELYKKGFFGYIITSGRIDVNRHNEARVMADYLSSNGIPRDRIIEDSTGYNSHATAVNFLEYSRQYNLKSVMVISQYYHILRIKLSFAKVGITNINHAHGLLFPEMRDFYYIPREIVGFYSYLIK